VWVKGLPGGFKGGGGEDLKRSARGKKDNWKHTIQTLKISHPKRESTSYSVTSNDLVIGEWKKGRKRASSGKEEGAEGHLGRTSGSARALVYHVRVRGASQTALGKKEKGTACKENPFQFGIQKGVARLDFREKQTREKKKNNHKEG